jgi:hypothetical protein
VIEPFYVQLTKHGTYFPWNSHVGPMGNKWSQPNLYLSSPISYSIFLGPIKSSLSGLNPYTLRNVSILAATTTAHMTCFTLVVVKPITTK